MTDTSYVVTGFPRSGTTLMMRMLEAGGLPVLASPDSTQDMNEFAPYGVYEFKDVDILLQEQPKEWTYGSVLKLVCPFFAWLPLDRDYRIVFMLRDIQEIISSLLAMRTVWEYAPQDAVADVRKFCEDLATLGTPDIQTHLVWYKDLVQYPKSQSLMISDFLELDMDIDKMAGLIDTGASTKYKKEGRSELLTDVLQMGPGNVDFNVEHSNIKTEPEDQIRLEVARKKLVSTNTAVLDRIGRSYNVPGINT